MITIIQGEDTNLAYKKLSELLDSAKNRGLETVIKDSHEIDPTTLRQEVSSSGLFGSDKFIVIKNLLSGSKAKQKDLLIKIINSSESDILLFESKKISDTALKQLPKAKVESFNVSAVIFKFLDLLRPGNFKQVLTGWNRLLELDNEPEYIFTMIVRQIRLLIQAKSGPSYLKLSAYPKKMITTQSNLFTLPKLLDLHSQLYLIDKKIKTGSSPLPLEQLLFQFFLKL